MNEKQENRKSYKEIPVSRESDPQLTPEMLEDIKREWREKEESEKQQKAHGKGGH